MNLCPLNEIPVFQDKTEIVQFLLEYEGIAVPESASGPNITNWAAALHSGCFGELLSFNYSIREEKLIIVIKNTPIPYYYHSQILENLGFYGYRLNGTDYSTMIQCTIVK